MGRKAYASLLALLPNMQTSEVSLRVALEHSAWNEGSTPSRSFHLTSSAAFESSSSSMQENGSEIRRFKWVCSEINGD